MSSFSGKKERPEVVRPLDLRLQVAARQIALAHERNAAVRTHRIMNLVADPLFVRFCLSFEEIIHVIEFRYTDTLPFLSLFHSKLHCWFSLFFTVALLLCRDKPLLRHFPVEVLEEGVEVFTLALCAMIEDERMFPHVEGEDDGKGNEMPLMLLA